MWLVLLCYDVVDDDNYTDKNTIVGSVCEVGVEELTIAPSDLCRRSDQIVLSLYLFE